VALCAMMSTEIEWAVQAVVNSEPIAFTSCTALRRKRGKQKMHEYDAQDEEFLLQYSQIEREEGVGALSHTPRLQLNRPRVKMFPLVYALQSANPYVQVRFFFNVLISYSSFFEFFCLNNK